MQAKTRKTKKANGDISERPQSADKVEAILKGAIQEFLEHGYAATTMDNVTAAAGVSKATVYSYFKDKESLFTALAEKLTCKNYEETFNPEDPKFWEGEPGEVLRRFAAKLLEKMKNQPEIRGLLRVIIGESGRFPVLAQIFVRNMDKKVFKHLVEYLKSCEELQLPDPEAAARVFMGTLVHYAIVQYLLQADNIMPMDSDRLIDTLIHFITCDRNAQQTDKYSGTRLKSSRRKRSASGKFELDYQQEPKRLRSIRLTDKAWEQLDAIAKQHNLTRSEAIEIFARNGEIEPG